MSDSNDFVQRTYSPHTRMALTSMFDVLDAFVNDAITWSEVRACRMSGMSPEFYGNLSREDCEMWMDPYGRSRTSPIAKWQRKAKEHGGQYYAQSDEETEQIKRDYALQEEYRKLLSEPVRTTLDRHIANLLAFRADLAKLVWLCDVEEEELSHQLGSLGGGRQDELIRDVVGDDMPYEDEDIEPEAVEQVMSEVIEMLHAEEMTREDVDEHGEETLPDVDAVIEDDALGSDDGMAR